MGRNAIVAFILLNVRMLRRLTTAALTLDITVAMDETSLTDLIAGLQQRLDDFGRHL